MICGNCFTRDPHTLNLLVKNDSKIICPAPKVKLIEEEKKKKKMGDIKSYTPSPLSLFLFPSSSSLFVSSLSLILSPLSPCSSPLFIRLSHPSPILFPLWYTHPPLPIHLPHFMAALFFHSHRRDFSIAFVDGIYCMSTSCPR